MDELLIQLMKPQVWVGLAATFVIAVAVYRFGRLFTAVLEPHVTPGFLRVVRAGWALLCVVAWVAVGTFVLYLPGVPVLFELGRMIVDWFRNAAGQMLVIVALALIAWHLVGSVSTRVVPADDFNRRSVRVATLKGWLKAPSRSSSSSLA
ncbi:hypothetical protein ACFP81_06835 [Deinococcus lacus]|uniref:Metallophosphoesterase n=1 Tax=Deinococcus lacus TaxID=392561 RepID=A0ABW1YBW2_9DEIO